MEENYDFSKGERGKFFKQNLKLNLPIYLDDDVYSFVQQVAKNKQKDLSFIVNQLIHSDMQIAETIR